MAPRPTAADLATRPVINRTPNTMAECHPRSAAIDAPARIIPDTETPSEWTPFGVFQPRPYFGGWDELSLHGAGVMHVAQAGTLDKSRNPFPNNGQFDRPNGFFTGLLRLRPDTSAHLGRSLPAEAPGPPMLFHAPPVFSVQVQPIPAVGV